jgi:FkbM family methyltransferase
VQNYSLSLKKGFRKICQRLSDSFNVWGRIVYSTPEELRVAPWFTANGDSTLRIDYDLNAESIVFDLGSYQGQWASDIFSKYCCSIYCFEPIQQFAEKLRKRFARNDKIKVFDFGLAEEAKEVWISCSNDGSSIFRGEKNELIKLEKASDFIADIKAAQIDLMKINIEGGEYDLLDHIIESGTIFLIKDLQVQFHDFVESSLARVKNIQMSLLKTHELSYQYPFVWENWRIKD